MAFVPTPTYLIEARLILTTWCPKCLTYGKEFTGQELAEKYGTDADLNDLAKRMVCDKPGCGHRGAKTQVNSIAARAIPTSIKVFP
jgi:hypothetical protein